MLYIYELPIRLVGCTRYIVFPTNFDYHIIYNTKYGTRKYEVCEIKIIKDTDWTHLEDKNENTITLITCLEDEPEYRRCIQGIEMEEI